MEYSAVNTIWVLVGAALVFFMQAGFAMVETGFTRAKNAGNIIMKNLMDFAIGTPLYWLAGFGMMFGGAGALVGGLDPLVLGDYSSVLPEGVPLPAFLIFQTVFCATAATIVSGAMAERTKFLSYCIYSAIISLVVYPISGHWIWGGGWLSQMGFHDFAGSTAVHMVGGMAALAGAKILGPRIGKYDKDGKPKAILGHSLTLGALGVFILWFAWFGFNCGSTLAVNGDIGHIAMTTNLAACAGGLTVMFFTWLRYGKPDVSMTLNGVLAGLVGITAGCQVITLWGALLVGLICGITVSLLVPFIDAKLKIDDPVGAISVHGGCGVMGTLLVGLLANYAPGTEDAVTGLLYGGGASLLGVQLLGIIAVAAWALVTSGVMFFIIKKCHGLRVPRVVEIEGLDVHEHGCEAYADFVSRIQ